LRRLLFERLDESLGSIEPGDFDEQYWGNIFHDGIDPLITTPRDITRLSNVIAVTFPVVRGEVNPVDFIAIETLRVFTPEIYHKIRSNKDEFTGSSGRHSSSNDERNRKFYDECIEKLPAEHRESIKAMLQRLFPKLQSVWGNMHYGSDFESQWRREKRVCSAEIFPLYFRLELSEGAIGSRDISRFIEKATDRKNVFETLISLGKQKQPSGVTRAHSLLQRLEDYTQEDIPVQSIDPIVLGLFDAGDKLIEFEPESLGIYSFGVETQIARIIFQLLRRLAPDERFSLLKNAVKTGNGLATIVHKVSVIGQMHGKYGSKEPTPEKDQIVTLPQLEELESLAADRISEAAQSGELISSVDFAYILLRWRSWSNDNECNNWIIKHEENEEFGIKLITSMLQVSYSHGLGLGGLGDRVSKKTYYINLKYMKEFIDPDKIEPTVGKLLKNNRLEPRQKLALETFLDCYRNPDKYDRY
jgi:predicted KAP-like P-loop ATPase